MLKPEMEIQMKEAHEIFGDVLWSMREPVDGVCRKCDARAGEAHADNCLGMRIALWRQKNHDGGLFGEDRRIPLSEEAQRARRPPAPTLLLEAEQDRPTTLMGEAVE